MIGGKKKAVTFSFDDGDTQDQRLIEIFDKYGLKCTFNLNSELLGKAQSLIREERTVARMRIVLPMSDGQAEINDFYRALGERVAQFCKETLFLRAEKAYRADPDPKKRFRFHTLVYSLTGEVLQDDDTYFRVRLCVDCVEPLGEHTHVCEEQTWEKDGAYLLRPKREKEKKI